MRYLQSGLVSLLPVFAGAVLAGPACSSDNSSGTRGEERAAESAAADVNPITQAENALEAANDAFAGTSIEANAEATAQVRVKLAWSACEEGFECATAALPRDYSRPFGAKLNIAVTRLRARNLEKRIGVLFVNFGGPGGDAVDTLHQFGAQLFNVLNERFDIIGFDPRGVGQSELAIDCHLNQETQGMDAQPFITPQNQQGFVARARNLVEACTRHNPEILKYSATANVARDMDVLRAALGENKLSYLGFSYGTFLGATYASLFPGRYRGLVLDGAVDADQYINRPMESLRQQSAAFERGLDRFFEACGANQSACFGFGGSDPHAAFDTLVARANASPIPVVGSDDRPVNGDDLLWATGGSIYSKQLWTLLAIALKNAQDGDGGMIRYLANSSYGKEADGSYSPSLDRYFALSAAEQRYGSDVQTYRQAGQVAWGMFDHFYWNAGYVELPLGLFPIHSQGVFSGPFRASASSPKVLVVGTTYDPATPYRSAVSLVDQLRNARLLTMRGDGHTAYGGNSACIDSAVETYLFQGSLPAEGTVCQQEIVFEGPQPAKATAARATRSALRANLNFVRALR